MYCLRDGSGYAVEFLLFDFLVKILQKHVLFICYTFDFCKIFGDCAQSDLKISSSQAPLCTMGGLRSSLRIF